jgi:hypothetical protein
MTDHLPPDDLTPDDHDTELDDSELDLALRRRLRDGLAAPRDPATELDILRPRFVHARRRRQARVAALSSAAAVLLVVAGVSLAGGRDTQVITPANPTASSTAAPSTSTSSTTPPPATTTTGVRGVGTPTTAVPDGSGASTTIPSASLPGTAPTTTARPVETPLVVAGGTVVVRSDATTVEIVSMTPTSGWTVAERKTEPTRIEVRVQHTGDSEQSRVIARVEHGQLRTDLS